MSSAPAPVNEVLRPLTLGELLDRTFTIYRRHALVFSGLVALPGLLAVGARLFSAAMLRSETFDFTRILSFFAAFMLLLFVSIVANAIAQAATMVAVSRVHLGQSITIAESYAAVRGRLVRICLITVALAILIMFGFLMLVIPGVFLALRWSLAIPATVLEDRGLGGSMDRSATLVEGQYGRIFVIYVLYFLLVMVFTTALQTPATIVLFMRASSLAQPPFWFQVVSDLAGFITQCLVGPLLTIAMALSYYDARVRKEGFDLQHMLMQLDTAEPQPQPAVP
jgi:hypothetical protein